MGANHRPRKESPQTWTTTRKPRSCRLPNIICVGNYENQLCSIHSNLLLFFQHHQRFFQAVGHGLRLPTPWPGCRPQSKHRSPLFIYSGSLLNTIPQSAFYLPQCKESQRWPPIHQSFSKILQPPRKQRRRTQRPRHALAYAAETGSHRILQRIRSLSSPKRRRIQTNCALAPS